MTATLSDDRAARRIALLLRQAEGAATVGEAEMYTQRATELLLKYQLDEATVRAVGDATSRPSEPITRVVLNYAGIYRQVLMSMHTMIVNALGGLRAVDGSRRAGPNRSELWVIGHESHVQRTRLLLTSLQTQCLRALETWWRAYDKTGLTAMQRFKERRQFIDQFGEGVCDRIARTRLTNEANEPGVALVLAHRASVVDQFMAQFDLVTQRTGGWLVGSDDATHAGRRAGLASNTHDTPINDGRRALDPAATS